MGELYYIIKQLQRQIEIQPIRSKTLVSSCTSGDVVAKGYASFFPQIPRKPQPFGVKTEQLYKPELDFAD